MPTAGADALQGVLAALAEDLARAVWRADAGLGPSADLPAVFARHPAATGPDAAELAREFAGDPATRPLAAWAVRLIGRRAGGEAEARARAWRASAVVRAPGGATVPYAEVDAALAAAGGDRAARLALDGARAVQAAAELTPLLRERWARERDAVEALGMAGGYAATWSLVEGVDARVAADAAGTFLRETDGAWRDALAEVARRRLGAAPAALPGGLVRGDMPALLADPALDALLPAGGALAAARTQAGAMGLDPTAGGRVRYDVGVRAGQRPGAWCAAVRVPFEVHVTVRPRAGVLAWRGVLGALGRALYAAYASPELPAEARYAGDDAVREGVARLFAGLAGDEGWLRRYADLDRTRAAAVRRQAGFAALRAARWDAAMLRLAVDVLEGVVPGAEAPDVGVGLLADATGARVAPGDVTGYLAPWLGVAARVRGGLRAAALGDRLRERFDDDWWRNPRAGPWLATDVLAHGGELAGVNAGEVGAAARAAERALG